MIHIWISFAISATEEAPSCLPREGKEEKKRYHIGTSAAPTFSYRLLHGHLVAADSENPTDEGASTAGSRAASSRCQTGPGTDHFPPGVEKLLHGHFHNNQQTSRLELYNMNYRLFGGPSDV